MTPPSHILWFCSYCIFGSLHGTKFLRLGSTESTDTDINVHIKHNAIRNISLHIVKDISDNDYGEISTIKIKSEHGSYPV